MNRTLFLVRLSTVAVAAWTPRIASAQTVAAPTRIVRRARARREGVPGRCADHRKTRWSSFTASDFLD